jgi:LPS-assembly protein
LPNYDSGANDFNFATVYTENAFGGNDRIADANLLTLGATSRFLSPDTGAEAMRLSVAQRLRFKDQNVTLPGGTAVQDRVSDLLLGATVNWDTHWAFDGTVQYNQKLRQSERSTLGARYNPGAYQVVNAAYRLQRDASKQIDISWQWPLDRLLAQLPLTAGAGAVRSGGDLAGSVSQAASSQGRWYSVGRLNYSVPDRRFVDSVLGFEYDGDCWLARFVLERLQRGSPNTTGGPESNKRILFQLEFVGFSRLGNNPIAALQQNIPRYQLLRERISTPSRYSNYE